jgi:hypothetical protein
VAGTLMLANAEAFITISLTEILVVALALSLALKAKTLSILTEIET